MNKTELVGQIALNSGLTKADATRALDPTIGAITNALAGGDSVQLIGFGTFLVRDRAARTGHGPKTNKAIQIAASKNRCFQSWQKS